MVEHFDIKYRQAIESGKYRVITENGYDVEIIEWDNDFMEGHPIWAMIHAEDNDCFPMRFKQDGNTYSSLAEECGALYVTDEPYKVSICLQP